MEDEYLTPGFDLSYSTPFRKAFNHDPNQSEDDSFTTAKSKATPGFNHDVDDDLDFLQNNLQKLALSDNQPSRYGRNYLQNKPSVPVKSHSAENSNILNSLNMGVAESKENHEDSQEDGQQQVQLPSFLNFGDTSPTPKKVHHARKPEAFSPPTNLHSPQQHHSSPPNHQNVPTTVLVPPRVNVSANTLVAGPELECQQKEETEPHVENSENEVEVDEINEIEIAEEALIMPQQVISEVPNPVIVQLQDELARNEQQFLKDVEEQDRNIAEKQRELQMVEAKLKAATAKAEKEKEAVSKLLKKQEVKMSQYASEIERLKSEFMKKESEKVNVIHEREQAFSDLRNVENAYNDLLGKYIRSKELAQNYSKNQCSLVARDDDIWQKVGSREQKIHTMKAQVQENLEIMHQEYEHRLREKRVDSENMRVRLMKMEMRVATLENDLEQKSQENAQLHKLCDEIINNRN